MLGSWVSFTDWGRKLLKITHTLEKTKKGNKVGVLWLSSLNLSTKTIIGGINSGGEGCRLTKQITVFSC